mmetsp:Transcript_6358/g.10546  ORF Transcript_6358/g.10546 Transcript_6358/m.10546 type:complete len:201 (-) Transcript_6358:552-1154(-)
MKVFIQNLQKRSNLATELLEQYKADVFLAQEIDWKSETFKGTKRCARFTSSNGYGTAIIANECLSGIRKIASPHSEFGGFIRKKTIVATVNEVEFVSFHGYNGQPMKKVQPLIDHICAVVETLSKDGPAVFAGDFNSWTKEHLDAIAKCLAKQGFHLALSWPYPGREFPLDHAFVRGVRLKGSSIHPCESDHNGALLEFE